MRSPRSNKHLVRFSDGLDEIPADFPSSPPSRRGGRPADREAADVPISERSHVWVDLSRATYTESRRLLWAKVKGWPWWPAQVLIYTHMHIHTHTHIHPHIRTHTHTNTHTHTYIHTHTHAHSHPRAHTNTHVWLQSVYISVCVLGYQYEDCARRFVEGLVREYVCILRCVDVFVHVCVVYLVCFYDVWMCLFVCAWLICLYM